MPAPWLIARTSGLYCRVFVPADLRPIVGQRFLVRALGARDRDQARLIAARYALAIGELFRQLRRELSVAEPKVEDILKAIKSGGTRDLTLKVKGVVSPTGGMVEEIVINNDEDARLVKEHFPGLIAGPARAYPAYGVLASERATQYCEYLSKTHDKYQAATKRVLQMLIDICGDRPPDDYDADAIDHFEKRIKFLPKNPDKIKNHRERWAKLNFAQIANDVELSEGIETIGDETMKGHFERLASFFNFCFNRRYMGQPSPMLSRVQKENGMAKNAPKRFAFTVQDLFDIFNPEHYKTRTLPHTFWPPLIALFTGARCNEIAQLYMDDIVNDDPQHPDRWRIMIRIGPGRTDQRLKNKFSNRSIPMHPRLIELGFLDYLNDVRSLGFERVFPSLRWTKAAGYGDTVSDMFSAYLRGKVKITEPKKVFHSFRHYFSDLANNETQYEQERIFDITGHKREGEFHLTYAKELHWPTKIAILNDIKLPKMELPVYKPGMFLSYLKATQAKRASEKAAGGRPKIVAARKKVATDKAKWIKKPKPVETTPKRFTLKATRKKAANTGQPGT